MNNFWDEHMLVTAQAQNGIYFATSMSSQGHVRPLLDTPGPDGHGQVGQLGTGWRVQPSPRPGARRLKFYEMPGVEEAKLICNISFLLS